MTELNMDDPSEWKPDQVVDYLYNSQQTWFVPEKMPALPAENVVRDYFRKEDINGFAFLDKASSEWLRQDLGIGRGQVKTFSCARESLEERAAVSQDHQAGRSVVTHLSLETPTRTLANPTSFDHLSRSSSAQDRFPSLCPTNLPEQSLHFPPSPEKSPYVRLSPQSLFQDEYTHQSALSSLRGSEFYVEDESGRKRRKLADLQTISKEDGTQIDMTLRDLTPDHTASIKEEAAGVQIINGKKRIQPCLLATLSSTDYKFSSQKSPENENSKLNQLTDDIPVRHNFSRGYLGSRNLPVDGIFFGSAKDDQPIDHNSHKALIPFIGTATDDGATEHLKTQDFNFSTTEKITSGRRLYVNNLMRNFLRNTTPVLFQKNGRKFVGVRPYSLSFVPRKQQGSFIMTSIDPQHDESMATRQRVLDWPEFSNAESSLKEDDLHTSTARDKSFDEANEDDQDFLSIVAAKWNQDDNSHVLPLYNDSGSDGECDSDTWAEIELEQGRQSKVLRGTRKSPLSTEEVDLCMKEAEEELIDQWKARNLPKLQRKAVSVWNKHHSARIRSTQVIKHKSRIEQIDQRILLQQRREIRKNSWFSVRRLKKQCTVFEPLVYEKQDLLWTVDILESTEVPTSFLPNGDKNENLMSRRKSPQLRCNDTDSGGEPESDLDDFIVGDDDEAALNSEESSTDEKARAADNDDFDPYLALPALPDSQTQPDPATPNEHLAKATPIKEETPSNSHLSPSLVKPRHKPQHPSIRTSHEVIDLTLSDPIDECAQSSQSLMQTPQSKKGRKDRITKPNERLDLLIKLLRGHGSLVKRLNQTIESQKKSDVYAGTQNTFQSLLEGKGYEENCGLSQNDYTTFRKINRLQICWHESRKIEQDKIAEHHVSKLLSNNRRFNTFFSHLLQALAEIGRDGKRTSGEDEVVKAKAGSLDQKLQENSNSNVDLPRKKRKRVVAEDAGAKKERAYHIRRAELYNEQLANSQEETLGNTESVIINPVGTEPSKQIQINPAISRRMKKHQIEGVRFMWRELVVDGGSNGCLLAHTMGLGKTMQVITLLVTISEAAKSSDKDKEAQIPPHLRLSRILILCPPALIDNWLEEFRKWIPAGNALGAIRSISSSYSTSKRMTIISSWTIQGGVLIMGYRMFQNIVDEKVAGPAVEHGNQKNIRKSLLEGPNIIVADEAHNLKNFSSKISSITKLFRSKSRIALTGSPLANRIEEYYSMVDWISPNYLGGRVEFRAKFVEPINDGLYFDSTASEISKSRTKLKVLADVLGPKINRADISVLKGDLKAKTEFVIKIPLTEIQMVCYKACVNFAKSNMSKELKMSSVFGWIHILSTLCCHPSCLHRKLVELAAKKEGKAKNDSSETSKVLSSKYSDDTLQSPAEPAAVDCLEENTEIPLEAIDALIANLKPTGFEQTASSLSYRTFLLEQILRRAIAVGDKCLVFSHIIGNLDMIEKLIIGLKLRYTRIDGTVNTNSRQSIVQGFNEGSLQVCLVATKAGGVGLNMQGANRVIIFDFNFNPSWEEQAIGRAYRFGQQKPVFVYRFRAGGTFEDRLYNSAVFKLHLATRVVDKKTPRRHASRNTSDYMFEPRPVIFDDLSSFKGRDPDVLDHILKAEAESNYRSICSIELTETIQADVVEHLSPEEESAAKREADLERLRISDPEAYDRQRREALMKASAARLQQMTPIQDPKAFTIHPAVNTTAHHTGQSMTTPSASNVKAKSQSSAQRPAPSPAHQATSSQMDGASLDVPAALQSIAPFKSSAKGKTEPPLSNERCNPQ